MTPLAALQLALETLQDYADPKNWEMQDRDWDSISTVYANAKWSGVDGHTPAQKALEALLIAGASLLKYPTNPAQNAQTPPESPTRYYSKETLEDAMKGLCWNTQKPPQNDARRMGPREGYGD